MPDDNTCGNYDIFKTNNIVPGLSITPPTGTSFTVALQTNNAADVGFHTVGLTV